MMLLGSDALHNIGDGAAIGASFLVSPRLGVAMAFAMIVHEDPEEVGDYAILRGAGMGRGAALAAMAAIRAFFRDGILKPFLMTNRTVILMLGLLAATACPPVSYRYSFPSKGGAVRFPKELRARAVGTGTPAGTPPSRAGQGQQLAAQAVTVSSSSTRGAHTLATLPR
jgi:hypothetical protein